MGLFTFGRPLCPSLSMGLVLSGEVFPEPVDGRPAFGRVPELLPEPGRVKSGLPMLFSVDGRPGFGRVTGLKTLSLVATTYLRSRYKLLFGTGLPNPLPGLL